MKLLRYGPNVFEQSGTLDDNGHIRDLCAEVVADPFEGNFNMATGKEIER